MNRSASSPVPSILVALIALVLWGALSPASSAAPPPERTLSVDVVELVAGKETPGLAELMAEHDGIAYLFATPENRARFEMDPRAFEVADGGACGKMGALSGMGDARRYLVHDGRVWFFASDGCREGFRKEPSKCIERSDPKPVATAVQQQEGARTLDLLARWAGGTEALRRMSTYREQSAAERTSGNRKYAWSREAAARFPDRAMTREAWDDAWFSTIRSPKGAAMGSSRGFETIARARGEAFDRVLGRSPVMIVRAWVDASAGGTFPQGSILVADGGESTLEGRPVRFVDVWMLGAKSRLLVDAGSGQLLQQSFQGRDGGTRVGDVVRTFTADAVVDGVRLPTAWKVTVDGTAAPDASVAIDRFEVNPTLAEDLFALGGPTTPVR